MTEAVMFNFYNVPTAESKRKECASHAIQKGNLVALTQNAGYYTGVPIPQWVKTQKWYVKDVRSNGRVIIDRNEAGTNSICSPIHGKDLAKA